MYIPKVYHNHLPLSIIIMQIYKKRFEWSLSTIDCATNLTVSVSVPEGINNIKHLETDNIQEEEIVTIKLKPLTHIPTSSTSTHNLLKRLGSCSPLFLWITHTICISVCVSSARSLSLEISCSCGPSGSGACGVCALRSGGGVWIRGGSGSVTVTLWADAELLNPPINGTEDLISIFTARLGGNNCKVVRKVLALINLYSYLNQIV